jgi:hypothetical protein
MRDDKFKGRGKFFGEEIYFDSSLAKKKYMSTQGLKKNFCPIITSAWKMVDP